MTAPGAGPSSATTTEAAATPSKRRRNSRRGSIAKAGSSSVPSVATGSTNGSASDNSAAKVTATSAAAPAPAAPAPGLPFGLWDYESETYRPTKTPVARRFAASGAGASVPSTPAVPTDPEYEYAAPKYLDFRAEKSAVGRRTIPETPSVAKYFANHANSPAFSSINAEDYDNEDLGDLLMDGDSDDDEDRHLADIPINKDLTATVMRKQWTAAAAARSAQPATPLARQTAAAASAAAALVAPVPHQDTPRPGAPARHQDTPRPGALTARRRSKSSARRKSFIFMFPTDSPTAAEPTSAVSTPSRSGPRSTAAPVPAGETSTTPTGPAPSKPVQPDDATARLSMASHVSSQWEDTDPPAPASTHQFTLMRATASTEHLVFLPSRADMARLTKTKQLQKLLTHKSPLRLVASPAIKKRKQNTLRGITYMKPFRLTAMNPTAASAARALPVSTVSGSLAAKVQRLLRTPDKSKRAVNNRVRALQAKRTVPQSPRLLTKLISQQRAHGPKPMTTEERELAELQQVKPFKAQPLNDKILKADRPLGVPPPKLLPTTQPHSPAITKPKPKPAPPSPPRPVIKAHPVPDFIHKPAPLPTRAPKRKTQPEPFTLPGESITERKQRDFADRVRREQEAAERLRLFQAQPLPYDDEPAPLPPKVERAPTEPKPFHLVTEDRALLKPPPPPSDPVPDPFTAQPIPEAVYDPFVVRPSTKPLTDPETPVLYTEDRAEDRRAFDLDMEARRVREEEERKRMAEEEERRVEAQIKRLRKQLVHKAKPVMVGKPIVIKHSTKPVTKPYSPMIGEKRKRAMLAAANGGEGGGGSAAASLVRKKLKAAADKARNEAATDKAAEAKDASSGSSGSSGSSPVALNGQ
ncbi:hypothetical protein AMAG_03889 [Allomyces macrogynus ATCC 38327]|uniref:TPX2 C-terminal domain-containing protein n=1 Tax=Allomyces macrogynus (strain ATCC 38327) TaxID=578462 RepID=A0A0L0SB56_ALLM3|nr:hypothetical protein AMAG_03889 [Allomyces macrogynus ATCC 38327]|eukprot:KNE59634.1 hypothetical protein AMAG_03889 [Allomyces macrogynus ATCC 38327]